MMIVMSCIWEFQYLTDILYSSSWHLKDKLFIEITGQWGTQGSLGKGEFGQAASFHMPRIITETCLSSKCFLQNILTFAMKMLMSFNQILSSAYYRLCIGMGNWNQKSLQTS